MLEPRHLPIRWGASFGIAFIVTYSYVVVDRVMHGLCIVVAVGRPGVVGGGSVAAALTQPPTPA